jgi:hypothetical protein
MPVENAELATNSQRDRQNLRLSRRYSVRRIQGPALPGAQRDRYVYRSYATGFSTATPSTVSYW